MKQRPSILVLPHTVDLERREIIRIYTIYGSDTCIFQGDIELSYVIDVWRIRIASLKVYLWRHMPIQNDCHCTDIVEYLW